MFQILIYRLHTLLVGKNITGESTDGSGVLTFDLSASGISSAFYETFDEERYSVHYSDGTIEDLTSDQFVLSDDGQTVTINGLKASQSNVVVSSTLKKQGLKSKQKNYIRSQRVNVESTAVGINTALTGMDQIDDYGLRVEDKRNIIKCARCSKNNWCLRIFRYIITNFR